MSAFGQRAYKAFMDQPKIAKGIEIGLVVGILAFSVGLPLIRLIRDKLDNAKRNREQVQAGKELDRLKRQGIYPTITVAQAEAMSNAMRVAFSGLGTDTGVITTVMRELQNEADVYRLVDVYGVRKYAGPWWWSSDSNYSLAEAISDELGSDQKKKINKILSDKGIKFQWA